MRQALRLAAGLSVLLIASAAGAAIVVEDPGPVLRGIGVDLRPGDRVTAWRNQQGRPQPIDDELAAWQLELERAPFGPLRVLAERGAQSVEIELPGGRWDWRLQASPSIRDEGSLPARRAHAWALVDAAADAAQARDWTLAMHHCDAAASTDSRFADALIERCWILFETHPDRHASVAIARRLVQFRRASMALPLLRARAELALARSAFNTRDYETAAQSARRALALASERGASNTVTAGALQVQGFIAYRHGEFTTSMTHYRAAAAMLATIAADSAQYASVQGAIATVLGSQGNLDDAVAMAERAIARMHRVAPAQMALGRLQYNAGLMAFERGRLGDAERLLTDAMATFTSASPAASEVAMSRAQLAQTLERRGESSRAEILLRTAVVAGNAIDAGAYEALSMRLQWSITLAAQQRIEEADRQVTAVIEATSGVRDDTLHADALAVRAELGLERGEPVQVLADADAAIVLLRPRDRRIQLAGVLVQRGEALRRMHRYAESEVALTEALSLRERLAPHTKLEAEVRLAIARLRRDQGDREAAIMQYAAALDALEAQRDLLGGNEESRARWALRSAPFYREALGQLLEAHHVDAAWQLLERYRARDFMATLGGRREALLARAQAPLRDEARAIAEDYLRAQKAAAGGAAIASAVFDRLKQRRIELERKLIEVDPRLAGLGAGQAATVAEIAAALPPDAALVSFAVLPARSVAFVLRAGEAEAVVIPLAVDAAALSRDIDALRLLLTVPGAGERSRAALMRRAGELHAQLMAPLDDALGDASRLFIVPDGPLHRLPFAALVEQGPSSRFLAESVSITQLVSANAYLASGRRMSREALDVAIFAVPDASAAADALPGARAEGNAIAALFAPHARLTVGADVTAAHALAELGRADIVHFASHAVVDPGDPLNSYLRMGDTEGARLSVWEIMRATDVRADLVTLSACDSALGLNAGGEGLIGLTRAFQFAGVRSVVATLWRIADLPTERFMAAFYESLANGAPRDVALARAQRTLIHSQPPWWQSALGFGADLSHPYYWSGFVLAGAPD